MSGLEYWIDDVGRFNWETVPVQGKQISFLADDVRRERTGMHATIYIRLADIVLDTFTFLSYDTFNITRAEDRTRLANRAYKASTNTVKDMYSSETLTHDLDLFCLHLARDYDIDRFIPEQDDGHPLAPLTFAAYPYIIKSGGTIFYGPPGAGKSMTLQAIGIEVTAGASGLWAPTEQRVLYVNLERSRESMMHRHRRLLAALGHEESQIAYLHARGFGLHSVAGAIRKFARDNPESLVILDSLSRAQVGGSLNDDTTANRFTDLMNSFGLTWAAIGHAPRNDATHAFGSVMQDAGADIMVNVSSQVEESRVGVQLKITKGNAISHHEPQYLALLFEESGLTGITTARPEDFGELATREPLSRIERVALYLQENGPSPVSTISSGTDMAPPNVSHVLVHSGRFQRIDPPGKGARYDLCG